MARGSEIILSAQPQGHFEECIISGTPKPGTVMEIVAGTAKVGGRFTYKARDNVAGVKGPVCILLADDLQGKLGVSSSAAYSGGPPAPGDAYVAGTRARIYWPLNGEEFNMICASQAGTADDVAIGDMFGIDANGKLIADSSYAQACFQAQELVTDPTAEYMMWVKYTGSIS